MYCDTHCHLNSSPMFEQWPLYVQNALANGVDFLCVAGYDLASSKRAVRLAHSDDHLVAAVGIGPEDCQDTGSLELAALEALLKEKRVVAVGEIGLDYHWDTVPKDKQQAVFKKQLALAKHYHLPVVIHSRDAALDTYEILKEAGVSGVMHCFGYSKEMAARFVELGFLISLAGPVTFKNARVPKEVAAAVDIHSLLCETDSPYLTPHPYRGKPNEPAYVPLIVSAIAALKNMDTVDAGRIMKENALRVFHLKESSHGVYQIADS